MEGSIERTLVLRLTEKEAMELYDAMINDYNTKEIDNFKDRLKAILHDFQDHNF